MGDMISFELRLDPDSLRALLGEPLCAARTDVLERDVATLEQSLAERTRQLVAVVRDLDSHQRRSRELLDAAQGVGRSEIRSAKLRGFLLGLAVGALAALVGVALRVASDPACEAACRGVWGR